MTRLGVRWPFHLALASAVAATACALDLASKWAMTHSAVDAVRFNPRPPAQLVPFVAVALLLLLATSLAGSRLLDLAAGALAGGALGNIASVLVWKRGIPDFIPARGVLLNGADPTIAAGVAGLVAVSLLLARHEATARAAR